MNIEYIDRAAALGRELRMTTGDARLVELGRIAANLPQARVLWTWEGDFLVLRVKTAGRMRAIRARRGTVDADALRALLRQALAASLLHEIVRCPCAARRERVCMAFMAFVGEAEA